MNQLVALHAWPDGFDTTVVVVYLSAVILLPVLGYWFMLVDIRAYLRALRGALVAIAQQWHGAPEWARRDTPMCVRGWGLSWPCSERELRSAYHRLAESAHPDRGGDKRRFLAVQQQFEVALRLLREQD